MPNESTTFPEAAQSRLGAAAGHVMDKASELGDMAAAKLDEQRAAAAKGMEKAADGLRETAGKLPGGERVAGMANAAADAIRSAGLYCRDHDFRDTVKGLKGVVEKNPGKSLLVAVALGFMFARVFSRDDNCGPGNSWRQQTGRSPPSCRTSLNIFTR